RGAALRRNHRVDAVLQHGQMIAQTYGPRAAGTAFADVGADNRHAQLSHVVQVARNGFALVALLGTNARIGAGSVDQRDHGQAETFGQFHQPQRLAVALRFRHAEVAVDLFLGVAPFLVADEHDRPAIQARGAADDGRIVGVGSVAVQLDEVGEHAVDVILRVGPLRVARQLRHLPGAQLAEDVFRQTAALFFQPADFLGQIDFAAVGHAP